MLTESRHPKMARGLMPHPERSLEPILEWGIPGEAACFVHPEDPARSYSKRARCRVFCVAAH